MAGPGEMIDAIASEAATLLASAERLLESFNALSDSPLGLLNVVIEDDGAPAAGALKLRLRLESSERAAVLVSALRAGNANLSLIEQVLGHLIQSPVGCDSATVEAPAGRAIPHAATGGQAPFTGGPDGH